MRKSRSISEQFFVEKFFEYFVKNIDKDAIQLPEVTDRPDMAIYSNNKIIGVEFSQIPSEYIINGFYRNMPKPEPDKNRIRGLLIVIPFEPHRWIYEVLSKKRPKILPYKNRINADEMWIVMHPPSINREWPMFEEAENNREGEALMMRFGSQQHRKFFNKIFYMYADNSVVDLSNDADVFPSKISLMDDTSYPAMTIHKFAFNFDVPLPGLGTKKYIFDDIEFSEFVIEPKDDWMANRKPNLDNFLFTVKVNVDSDKVIWRIFRDEVLMIEQINNTHDLNGKSMGISCHLELNVKNFNISYTT